MKIGIVYYSKTGATKKLSEIAAIQLQNASHEVSLLPLEDYKYDMEGKYDLIIIGSYCDSNDYPKEVRDFLNNKNRNKCLASFVTHATYESGKYYDDWAAGCEIFYKNYCKENAIENKGYFHCRSKPSIAVALFIKMAVIKDKDDWEEYKKDMNDYPGDNEINSFKRFINTLVE